jgi:tetratricopeptide (TPR) repeat protein
LALFSRKKEEERAAPTAAANGATPKDSAAGGSPGSGGGSGGSGGTGGSGASGGSGGYEFSPEKARKFFDRARTAHETTNFEYAMTLWLSGLKFDPTNLEAIISFFQSASALLGTKEGARGPGKETLKEFSGSKSDLDKYLASLLVTSVRNADAHLAVRAAEAAAKLGIRPAAIWLADRARQIALGEKRQRKDYFVDLMEVYQACEAFDKAVLVGDYAVKLDPLDGKLAGVVRNLSAESTMSKGGYEQAGKEGAFRGNIRDVETQKRLEEEERIVKTEETMDRLVDRARREYEANPADRPAVTRYVQRLLERGRLEDEQTAMSVLQRAFDETQEFRFRQAWGDLRLKQMRRDVAKLKEAADRSPGDPGAAEAFAAARTACDEEEIREFEARVAAYPSDRVLKFELGKRLFEAGRYNDCIAPLQQAQDEPKQRLRVLGYLGQAFQAIEFYDGAIETYRKALESSGTSDGEFGMELRYGLMRSLQGRAQEAGDLGSAEEAYSIASKIAIQNFSYKDIRTRREELKALVAKLKGGA